MPSLISPPITLACLPSQGDLAQDRLALHGARRLPGTDNFYLRGDGTRCYYFGMVSGLAGLVVNLLIHMHMALC